MVTKTVQWWYTAVTKGERIHALRCGPCPSPGESVCRSDGSEMRSSASQSFLTVLYDIRGQLSRLIIRHQMDSLSLSLRGIDENVRRRLELDLVEELFLLQRANFLMLPRALCHHIFTCANRIVVSNELELLPNERPPSEYHQRHG
ncbi:hypothetical protein QTP88_023269 [Uroleucon formosanum]